MSLSPGKPVLVFDLDDTLISSEKVYDTTIFAYRLTAIKVNEKLLEIIHTAKGKGWQILLLTNNENAKVIFHGEERRFMDVSLAEIARVYTEKYGEVDHLFDHILTAEKPEKGRNSVDNTNSSKRTYLQEGIDTGRKNKKGDPIYYYKPVKSLEDVRTMLGYPVKGSNVYFFDDDNGHQLCHESNFVHIKPKFGSGEEDKTVYPIIYAKGGKRTRRRGGRGKRGSKGSRRKLKELRHGM